MRKQGGVLQPLVFAVVLGATSGCGGGGGSTPSAAGSVSTPAPTATPTAAPAPLPTFTALPAYSGAPTNLTAAITVGAPQTVFAAGTFNEYDTGDVPFAFLRQPDGTYRVWSDSNVGSTVYTTPDLLTWTPTSAVAAAGLTPQLPFGSLGSFDDNYAGITAVFPASNGHDLLAIYHAEYHYGNPPGVASSQVYSIGLARSSDNGSTWTKQGQIISGVQPIISPAPLNNVSNIGTQVPSVILAGGYIYVITVDYTCCGYNQGPGYGASLLVARAPASSDGAPGSWVKYYNGSYNSPGLGGPEDDTWPYALVPGGCHLYQAVTYNSYYNAYVMMTQYATGMYLLFSTDLVHWNSPTQVLSNLGNECSYFTSGGVEPTETLPAGMISAGSSSMVSGQTGWFYTSQVPFPSTKHTLFRQSFTIGTATGQSMRRASVK